MVLASPSAQNQVELADDKLATVDGLSKQNSYQCHRIRRIRRQLTELCLYSGLVQFDFLKQLRLSLAVSDEPGLVGGKIPPRGRLFGRRSWLYRHGDAGMLSGDFIVDSEAIEDL